VTKAKLEALFETAGMGKNSDGAKQLADPEVSCFPEFSNIFFTKALK